MTPDPKNSKIENPRVRFAPSPTGLLHVGSARTALFNFLFARHYGGDFILRIEDTDKERSKKEYEENIIEGLRWLHLNWDEGPDILGKFGPYRQSERKEIYKQYLKKLLAENRAYYCFCTEDDLKAQREEMIASGTAPRYSGHCADLPEELVQQYLKENRPYTIRFRMPSGIISFKDLIRGTIKTDLSLIGDIIIAKSWDEPLYNFSVVVDDYLMGITHIIRGEDHISNTPKQIALIEALGFSLPAYAHLPLILNEDRTKLSKRDNLTVSISDYQKQGYLWEAIDNFLALLGWHSSSNEEIFSLDRLIKEFSIERIQKGGAVFLPNKLNWLNKTYINKKDPSELTKEVFNYACAFGFLQKKEGSNNFVFLKNQKLYSEEQLIKYFQIEKSRVNTLAEFFDDNSFLFRDLRYDPALLFWKQQSKEDVKIVLDECYKILYNINETQFSQEMIKAVFDVLIKNNTQYNQDKGWVLWPLRVALSGLQYSPSPFEILEVLGKEESLRRIKLAREVISGLSEVKKSL